MKPITKAILRIPGIIARDLGVKIVSGRMKPGRVLDGEVAASGQRQVSRSAYREAIHILVAKGLVAVQAEDRYPGQRPVALAFARSGCRVVDFPGGAEQGSADQSLRAAKDSRAGGRRSCGATALSPSPEAHGCGAGRDGASHAGKKRGGGTPTRIFHTALLEASGNLVLGSLTRSINSAVTWSTVFKQRFEPLKRDPVPDHRKVYDAIADGHPSAARKAMAELVDLAYFDITNASKWPAEQGRGPRE